MAVGDATRDGSDLRAVPAQGTPPQTSSNGPAWPRAVLEGLQGDWRVLHARHWPHRSYDMLDHVVVGPTGIFIVDSVGWSGEVEMTPDLLQVNGRVRLTAVQAAHDSARELALLLSPDVREHVFPVICMRRVEAISGWVKAVRVCTTATLDELIETREPALTPAQVSQIADELEALLPETQAAGVDRKRASDQMSGLQRSDRMPDRADTRWYRGTTGRIAGGVFCLAVTSALVLVGVQVTAEHPTSDDLPTAPHSSASTPGR